MSKATHPGEVLREEFLKPMKMSRKELAKRLKLSYRTVCDICNEKRDLTIVVARRLSQVFKNSIDFWWNLQDRYNEASGK